MKKSLIATILTFHLAASYLFAQEVGNLTTTWSGNAEEVYDHGFVSNLMRTRNGGVSLFNMVLVENDSPGGGMSDKGISSDYIWGKNRGRKILYLDDERTMKAWLVVGFYNGNENKHIPPYPLKFTVNGNQSEIPPPDMKRSPFPYQWIEFPANWLKKGRNIIELFCPEAENEEEGWELFIHRADEFEAGGGNPEKAGETSFKSFNGGRSWKKSPFGKNQDIRAEYNVRLSLDRYCKSGALTSPVIDLWKGDSDILIVPLRETRNMNLRIEADAPEGTKVDYYFRKGMTPEPFNKEDWDDYVYIGSGPSLDYTLGYRGRGSLRDRDYSIGSGRLNRRYVQFKAVLSTENPLKTPVIKSVDIKAELYQTVERYENIVVLEYENDPIRYSSLEWKWEKWDRPELQELRDRENLDEVIAGSRTEFDAQVKLMEYIARRYSHSNPKPEYPAYDAISTLNRVEYAGAGGYCLSFATILAGMYTAYGWPARMIHVNGHEVCEVWNDDYGKWVYLDADNMSSFQFNYNYLTETAEPLNWFELHPLFLDYFFPHQNIDWMDYNVPFVPSVNEAEPPVRHGALTNLNGHIITGFTNGAYFRVIPRTNWHEQKFPRPLNHSSWTIWDGYVNWYDERTPPNRQYSSYTDRMRDLWPDLNKVYVHVTQGFGNDRLFLRFETYTPNFSHYEVNVDRTGWKKVSARYAWLLQSGLNKLEVRAVNMLGAKGKPSTFVLNHADAPLMDP